VRTRPLESFVMLLARRSRSRSFAGLVLLLALALLASDVAPAEATPGPGYPLTGDWNGDGRETIGWYVDGTVTLTGATSSGGGVRFTFGRAGDVPVVGDWNGDGRTTIGVRRGNEWLLRNANSRGPVSYAFVYGRPTDVPVTGDWNGDGRTTIGVRRGSEWLLRNANSRGPVSYAFVYGRPTDVAVTGDWNRDGRTTIGVRRGSEWLLRNANSRGPVSYAFMYGRPTDVAVTGDWNGDGRTTIGVVRGDEWLLRNANSRGPRSSLQRFGPSDDPSSSSTATSSSSPFGGRRHFGVATASNGWNNAELAHVANVTGARPSLVLHYLGFPEELQPQQLQTVAEWGAMPFLTWEPFDWRAHPVTSQPDYALRRITEGRFDAYLTRTARALKAFDRPVLLRFAHEMNGDWYPWSEQINGNRPGDYVAAWRHVHALFERERVDNVFWVWSPNVEYPGSQSLASLYPGSAYVDVIALDGYNWGSTAASGWQTPGQVFDPTVATVRRLAPGVPLMIGETASSERGGSKADWNAALFDWLARQPEVEALVWFHLDKETDWRIDSSSTSASSFRRGVERWLGP
jgi:hypothetical protein